MIYCFSVYMIRSFDTQTTKTITIHYDSNENILHYKSSLNEVIYNNGRVHYANLCINNSLIYRATNSIFYASENTPTNAIVSMTLFNNGQEVKELIIKANNGYKKIKFYHSSVCGINNVRYIGYFDSDMKPHTDGGATITLFRPDNTTKSVQSFRHGISASLVKYKKQVYSDLYNGLPMLPEALVNYICLFI